MFLENMFLERKCKVFVENDKPQSGCLMNVDIEDCGTRKINQNGDTIVICCCDTPKCNTREFIEACSSNGVKPVKLYTLLLAILSGIKALRIL